MAFRTCTSLVGLALLGILAPAPLARLGAEEIGALSVRRERAAWPDPESLARDLRSPDAAARVKALRILGLADFKLIEERPEQVDLRYAALGEDGTRQAVLAVQISQFTFAAVAVPKGRAWERIALFDCWCKYDLDDALGEFVGIRRAPAVEDRFELVVRASGGGSGIYEQNEARFRIFHGELRRAISFVSRKQSCPAAPIRPCEFEMRWLSQETLVTVGGTFDGQKAPSAVFRVPPLQVRDSGPPRCTSYKWNQATFQYERAGPAGLCSSQ